jgi:hypothetical protein
MSITYWQRVGLRPPRRQFQMPAAFVEEAILPMNLQAMPTGSQPAYPFATAT